MQWTTIMDVKILFDIDSETPVSIQGSLVRADWYDAGEGLWGDYDPENPRDVHLLRFDIYIKRNGNWEPVDDASYCTLVPADTERHTLVNKLYTIYKGYEDALSSDPEASVKKLGECLSWISA